MLQSNSSQMSVMVSEIRRLLHSLHGKFVRTKVIMAASNITKVDYTNHLYQHEDNNIALGWRACQFLKEHDVAPYTMENFFRLRHPVGKFNQFRESLTAFISRLAFTTAFSGGLRKPSHDHRGLRLSSSEPIAKLKEVYKEFWAFTDSEPMKIMKHCAIPWLSLEKCVKRALQQWPALRSYFNSHEDGDQPGRVQPLKESLTDPLTRLIFSFLEYIIPMMTDFNTTFQEESEEFLLSPLEDLSPYRERVEIQDIMDEVTVREEVTDDSLPWSANSAIIHRCYCCMKRSILQVMPDDADIILFPPAKLSFNTCASLRCSARIHIRLTKPVPACKTIVQHQRRPHAPCKNTQATNNACSHLQDRRSTAIIRNQLTKNETGSKHKFVITGEDDVPLNVAESVTFQFQVMSSCDNGIVPLTAVIQCGNYDSQANQHLSAAHVETIAQTSEG
ncbi:hypothetical protein MAR_001174 [Mya arenaria]|uniref:Uncharacterized protein n=1 Tax=Mya arenaria TaxID=6604 RepID=A0ABY7FEF5_MYAAR|nr:hypothetical protein MAR_001174 [Mya arenaria]